MKQLKSAIPSTWGGRRSGSGRKPNGDRAGTPHRARPVHRESHPVHVTLRSELPSLRTQLVFPAVRDAISEAARASPQFRVVEFSVQGNHLQLIVEATDEETLSSGMRGLTIRVARQVNRLISRRGRFWADRWHGRALTSPQAVRNALLQVLANSDKDSSSRGARVDPYSSAPYFCFFAEWAGVAPITKDPSVVPRSLAPPGLPPVVRAKTWLLREGWRKHHGALSVDETPDDASKRHATKPRL